MKILKRKIKPARKKISHEGGRPKNVYVKDALLADFNEFAKEVKSTTGVSMSFSAAVHEGVPMFIKTWRSNMTKAKNGNFPDPKKPKKRIILKRK